MTNMRRIPRTALLCLAALAAGCMESNQRGSIRIIAAIRNTITAADVNSVTVTISAASTTIISGTLGEQSGAWDGLFVLSPGTYDVLANAYDNTGKLIFTATRAGVLISENNTTTLALILQDASPVPNFKNNPPLITSLLASTDQLFENGTVTLTANVVDLDSDLLNWTWTQLPAGEGVFGATSGSVPGAPTETAVTTTWTAPAAPAGSSVSLNFTVDDGKGSPASISVAIGLIASQGTGSGQITVLFNDPPFIDTLAVGPSQAQINTPVSLTAHATTLGSNELSYQWAANSDCNGAFAPATGAGAAVSFTPTQVPTSNSGQCIFTVTVDDAHGGIVTGTTYLLVTQGGPPAPLFPPTITSTSQPTNKDFDQSPVALSVSASSNNGLPLTFNWSVVGGTFASATAPAGSSAIVWTPAGCDGNAHSASVIVGDGSTLVQEYSFLLQTCATSCQEQKQVVPASLNGFYLIDADGPGGNPPVSTYCDDMGSGQGLDFSPTSDTLLPGGVNRFLNIHIPAGVTVRIDPARNNGVLDLRATGDVIVQGSIDVSGGAGGNGPTYPEGAELWVGAGGGDTGNPLGAGAVAPSSPAIGSATTNTQYDCGPLLALVAPGGGGQQFAGTNGVGYYFCGVGGHGGVYGGGMGGLGGGGGGGGWGGGSGGTFSSPYSGGNGGGPFGGAAPGQGGVSSDANYAGGNAVAGSATFAFQSGGGGSIGSDAAADLAMLTTFRPGSAGGGGGGQAGAGGGGGGGALRIISPTTVTIASAGAILANGGSGGMQTTVGTYFNPGAHPATGGNGGGGSGGAIYISAPTVNFLGHLSAAGGQGGRNAALFDGGAGQGGDGGLGRIRIAADTVNLSGPCLGCAPVQGSQAFPPLPESFDGSANGSGLAFVSPRYPYELYVNAKNPQLINNTEYHLAAGSTNIFAMLTVDPGFSLIIDPPTDCTNTAQLQMTTVQVGGDMVVHGTMTANASTCPAATYAVPTAAQAMGAPATVTLTPGASGGSGGNGGNTGCDHGGGCGLQCGAAGGSGPDGRNGGAGGSRANGYGFCGPRGMCGCHYDYAPAGGAAGPGSGQPLFLKIGGTLTGTGAINANGDNGGAGTAAYPAICNERGPWWAAQATGAGGGGGGAGGAGGYVVARIHGLGTQKALPLSINVAAGQGGAGGPPSPGFFPCYGEGYGGGGAGGPGDTGSAGLLDLAAY